ncbi:hypothetical protein GZH53_03830 [Flavihumibacter sp. R14]|nr:hypothetical protein [Flavihumibacter soli]
MFKEIAKKIFSTVFLFIFFAKMAISVAPLLIVNMDEKSVYSVIMQLEIEHQTPKGAEAKWEEIQHAHHFNFAQPLVGLLCSQVFSYEDQPIQSFYPSVPTPPPNA